MKLFVYGSLREGFPNHHLLLEGGAIPLGNFESEENLYMVGLKSGAYPYVLDEPVHPTCIPTTIKGEVYEVTYNLMRRLDTFEGHPHHYTRTTLIVHQGNKFQPTIAYTYIVINEYLKSEIAEVFEKKFNVISSGDWANN